MKKLVLSIILFVLSVFLYFSLKGFPYDEYAFKVWVILFLAAIILGYLAKPIDGTWMIVKRVILISYVVVIIFIASTFFFFRPVNEILFDCLSLPSRHSFVNYSRQECIYQVATKYNDYSLCKYASSYKNDCESKVKEATRTKQ